MPEAQSFGQESIKVKLTPTPTVVALSKGKEVDQKRGMTARDPGQIVMKAKAESSFMQLYPGDSKFEVSKWEAFLVRESRPIATKKFTTQEGDLSSFAPQAKSGDRILIDVKQVTRKNCNGEIQTVRTSPSIINIPLK